MASTTAPPPQINLPPGQSETDELPRFGLTRFAERFPTQTETRAIDIGGDVEQAATIENAFENLTRVEQRSDFHCVTTWTKRDVAWSGIRFSDFYSQVIAPHARSAINFVVFSGQDGYRVGMQLEDLLANDVLLADRLDGQPLPIAHGAPIRLVAPAHYGYKSAKHVARIEFWREPRGYRSAGLKFMDHPRARVAYEERGSVVPGRVLRWLYRPLIEPTKKRFARALAAHLAAAQHADDH